MEIESPAPPPSISQHRSPNHWLPPSWNFLKINFNGAFSQHSTLAVQVIARNEEGNLIEACAKSKTNSISFPMKAVETRAALSNLN